MSAILEFLTGLIRLLSDLFSSKRKDREDLWEQIQATRNNLVLALEEGRLTDVAILRKQLDRLMEEYSKYTKYVEKRMRSSVFLAVVMSVSLLSSGCLSHGRKSDTTVFVSGDRIMLVRPGSEIVVPELTSPAKQWYLVDNVGLQHWLGIDVDYGNKEITVRKAK